MRYPFLCCLVLIAAMGGCSSHRPHVLGVDNGSLSDCPDSPNCVSSQSPTPDHFISPLRYTGTADDARRRLLSVLRGMKRTRITVAESRYVHAECTSFLFRFVDDVEFLIDDGVKAVHVRSASRTGHSDLGVNRRRIETIRKKFNLQK